MKIPPHGGPGRHLAAGAVWLTLVLLAATCTAGRGSLRSVEAEPALERLVLMLDGVPWPVMDSLWNAGRFRSFLPPSRLISPFPSLTGLAFRDIWDEPPIRGYEDRYYDRDRRRLAGGLLDHVFDGEQHAGFHRHIDVQANGVAAGLAYLLPLTMARHELAGLRRSIAQRMGKDTTIVAYFVSTDAIAHRGTRSDLVGVLLEIEALLDDVRAAAGARLEIVLFSDHGNDGIPTRRADLDGALRAAGYEPGPRVRGPADVAIPAFGLVGSAAIYTWPGAESGVANALRTVAGVDFAAHRDSTGRIHVLGPDGHAIVTSNAEGSRFRYQPLTGDPLRLNGIARGLTLGGQADPGGEAPDSTWLRATLEAPFIDPLRRLTLGLRSVDNPADVIVSLAPGYHFGDEKADAIVGVTGTHGSLRSTSSLAFVMASHVRVPDPVRSDDLERHIPLPRRASPERTHR